MRVTLLGTGSADGWPNPFCTCASCDGERREGRSRAPSSALVDDVVLVDCGPTVPHAISRLGRHLRDVEHVLLTHGHPDHLDPAFLLSREWVSSAHVLHVWGPPLAIDLCRDWLGPDSPVELHPVSPGDHPLLATAQGVYRARFLAARHGSGNGDALADEALLVELTDPRHERLIYATDTGPVDAHLWDGVGPAAVVLMDETFGDTVDHGTGHLDLSTLPDFVAGLRVAGAITGRTLLVATHLSHHNPPTGVLRTRLAELEVLVLDDLVTIDTRYAGGVPPLRRLVLGGARSGKSTFAEALAAGIPTTSVTYVATGGSRADDAEWTERVDAHRARRPAHWTTVESLDLVAELAAAPAGSVILIDCLALWLTGRLDALDAWARAERGAAAVVRAEIAEDVTALGAAIRASGASVIAVSNEAGMGVVPATGSGRLFRDLLGIVNSRVADACDEVTLMVAGRPLRLDSAPHDRREARA